MKKLLSIMAVLVIGIFLLSDSVYAQAEEDFIISAEVPTADVATFTVNRVTEIDGAEDEWVELESNDLNFGQLSLETIVDGDDVFQVFLPSYYFAIDIASDGVGNPDVQVTYDNISEPAGATATLGERGTIAFSTVIYGEPEPVDIAGMALQDLGTYDLEERESGSWLRAIVGIASGDPTLSEGTATPFTASDAPGTYSGQLTFITTFD